THSLFHHTPTTHIYPLSLHDALPISMTRDQQVFQLIEKEKARQTHGIELIASENFASPQVMEAAGSVLTNKYAEGLPGKRYYGRSEEHTSELQSRENLVCRLLLEKKK